MRPLRCSSRFGFHGISKWIIREQWFWRSMPSEAASVASRMRTGLCFGSVWNAALIRSRSFESIPPYMVISRSLPVRPSAARTPCSQFCVARYSVKMMTRSSDHLPPGRMCSLSQRISPFGLGVELGGGPFRPRLHLLQQRQLLGRRLPEQEAGGVEGLVGRLLGLVVDRVVLVHPVDLALEDAPGGPGDALPLPGVCGARTRAAPACGGRRRGWRRAASSGSSARSRWRTARRGPGRSPAGVRSTASGRRGCASPRRGNRPRGPPAPAWGTGLARSRPWAVRTSGGGP